MRHSAPPPGLDGRAVTGPRQRFFSTQRGSLFRGTHFGGQSSGPTKKRHGTSRRKRTKPSLPGAHWTDPHPPPPLPSRISHFRANGQANPAPTPPQPLAHPLLWAWRAAKSRRGGTRAGAGRGRDRGAAGEPRLPRRTDGGRGRCPGQRFKWQRGRRGCFHPNPNAPFLSRTFEARGQTISRKKRSSTELVPHQSLTRAGIEQQNRLSVTAQGSPPAGN